MAAQAERRRDAMRELTGGAPATPERLAAVSGLTPMAIRRFARLEGWTNGRRQRLARMAALSDRLLARLEALEAEIDDPAGPAGKALYDAITAVCRMQDRVQDAIRAEDAAQANQTRQDEDVAGILSQIDDRIVELAEAYARELAMARPDAGPGPAGDR